MPGSQGRLCLGGTIGRFNALVTDSGRGAILSMDVDTTRMPRGGGTASIQPGETWSLQMWFRDLDPGVTSNFTNRVSETFE